jgi:hypothetical protein
MKSAYRARATEAPTPVQNETGHDASSPALPLKANGKRPPHTSMRALLRRFGVPGLTSNGGSLRAASRSAWSQIDSPAPNPGEAVQALAGDGYTCQGRPLLLPPVRTRTKGAHLWLRHGGAASARGASPSASGACSNGNALALIIAGSLVLIARDEGPEEFRQCAQPRRRPLPMLRLRPQSHSRDPRLTWLAASRSRHRV